MPSPPLRRTAFRTCLLVAATCGLALPAAATNHLIQFQEVMIGAFGRKDVQFIEMRILDCSQVDWGPQFGATASRARLVFFNASDNQIGVFNFPSDPACGTSRSVLIATQAFANLPGMPDPDFIMPALARPGSGKICFKDNVSPFPVDLCITYGSFNGDTEEASGVDAPSPPAKDICSLTRTAMLNHFGEPNDNGDFTLASTKPRNSAEASALVVVPPRFDDVGSGNPFFLFIESMANEGVTAGCGSGDYCPASPVTRAQMAVFLLKAAEGAAFLPPACTVPSFNDVPCSNGFSRWINELADRGITSGCGGGGYCPGSAVTRAQMAVFLLKTQEGNSFVPPPCISPAFTDVPCGNAFAPWINELASRGITGGCGGGKYCPGNVVTRGQMAVFLNKTFALPLPVKPADTACPAPPPPPPSTCAHDKCVTGVALDADCSPCVNQICAVDSFCCTTLWDSICVGHVSNVCQLSCS